MTSNSNANAPTLSSEVSLGQITMVNRIAIDNQRIALGDTLNGLAGHGRNDGQLVIGQDEVGGAKLMTLRQSQNIRPIELAVIFFFNS